MAEGVYGPQPSESGQQPSPQKISPQEIQQFLKVQEEMKQVEALLTVAQNMDKQHVQKKREKAQTLALSPKAATVSGNTAQQANTQTYNDLQPLIGTEIQSLSQQIAILKKGDPAHAKEYDSFLNQLNTISKSYPQLSQQQLGTLNTIESTLEKRVSQTDPQTQAAFWNETGNMLQKMYVTNGQKFKALEAHLNQLKQEKAPPPEIEAAQKAVINLGATQNALGKAAAGAALHAQASGSLPNDFQNAILHHYMPGQEKYLMQLAEILMFDNMGAQIGNALLDQITGFSAAATVFDFSNSLHDTGKKHDGHTVYNGSASDANKKLDAERAAAAKDIAALKKAIATINEKIKSIQNNPNLTSAQKTEMINKLQGIKTQLKTTLGYVEPLLSYLKGVHATAVPGGGFTLSGNMYWVNFWEGATVNGLTPEQAKSVHHPSGGGLVSVDSQVKSFQQNYADQGQNQQMTLQMRMTEIQQEWSTVSTAMQELNQMYSTVAKGISK